MIVTSEAAAMFTAVLPSRISPIRRSGRCSSRSATRAAAMSGARLMPQPITVEAHQCGFGAGEERGQHEQHDDHETDQQA